MVDAKISTVIKRRALDQTTFPELKECYVRRVMENPFLPDDIKDMAADIVDHHLNAMAHELERLEIASRRIEVASKEEVMAKVAMKKPKAAPKKKSTRKDKAEVA